MVTARELGSVLTIGPAQPQSGRSLLAFTISRPV